MSVLMNAKKMTLLVHVCWSEWEEGNIAFALGVNFVQSVCTVCVGGLVHGRYNRGVAGKVLDVLRRRFSYVQNVNTCDFICGFLAAVAEQSVCKRFIFMLLVYMHK